MKRGDLVRDFRTGDVGYITDTYMQPQINKLYIKMFAVGRETGWILADEVEPVQPAPEVVE